MRGSLSDTGPLGGIVTGLMALGAGAHLVVACDMPYVQPAVLELLRRSATPEWDAVVPLCAGQPEPLCALYGASATEKLRAALEGGMRSVRAALQNLRVLYLDEAQWEPFDPGHNGFTNWNTPQDIQQVSPGETP